MRVKISKSMRAHYSSALLFFVAAASILVLPTAVVLAQVANTGVGSGALWSLTTGTENSAFGYDTLFSDTTGSFNTAVGSGALDANVSGIANTAIGEKALIANTASYNTATGYLSLTLNTSGTLNIANGYLALYANSTGQQNTAVGVASLYNNSSGGENTAVGLDALYSNTTGTYNTANGWDALFTNSSGVQNTANGVSALYYNSTGNYNAASGLGAMFTNTTGSNNAASGFDSLYYNTTGSNNIALGYFAGEFLTTGNYNIDIGNTGVAAEAGVIRVGTSGDQTATFISGIDGVTSTGGVAVYINSNGQLGTVTSSRRFKYDINDLGDISDKLMKLRPVMFRYKQAAPDGSHPIQYGLIAEEVAAVSPDLVQYDKEGKPFTVYYNLLTPMLLNEFQKEYRRVDSQQTEINALKSDVRTQRAELDEMKHAQQPSPLKVPVAFGFVGFALAGCVLAGRARKTR